MAPTLNISTMILRTSSYYISPPSATNNFPGQTSFTFVCNISFIFFFFQAEDGIRDHCVTGVQTCALPILLGEDPDRDGLRHTPERFEKALRFLTGGYHQDQEKVLNGAMFSVTYDQMVLVKDIEVYSLCEHHMLPFFGKCHVAYIPDQ